MYYLVGCAVLITGIYYYRNELGMKLLLTAFDMLVKLDEEQAAIEVENTITRLENNSY